KASRLERAYAEMEQKLGRAASDAEMIDFLKITVDEFDVLVCEARGVALLSLDELQGSDHDENFERNLLEYLADPEHLNPAQIMNLDQIYRIVADTIDQLPEKERLVISLYYYEELTMKEIGEILQITESRVSQIHTKAILRLRGRLISCWRFNDDGAGKLLSTAGRSTRAGAGIDHAPGRPTGLGRRARGDQRLAPGNLSGDGRQAGAERSAPDNPQPDAPRNESAAGLDAALRSDAGSAPDARGHRPARGDCQKGLHPAQGIDR